jgi:hypothetical protein
MNELTRRGLIFGTATIAAYGMLVGVERVCQSAFADDNYPEDSTGPVKIVKFSDDAKKIGLVTLSKVKKTRAEWKKQLTPLQYDITRRAATEFAFSGALFHHKIRLRDRLAQLLGFHCRRKRLSENRHHQRRRAPGSKVHPMRSPSRPYLHRRPQSHRPALLHELRRPPLPTARQLLNREPGSPPKSGIFSLFAGFIAYCFTSASKSS